MRCASESFGTRASNAATLSAATAASWYLGAPRARLGAEVALHGACHAAVAHQIFCKSWPTPQQGPAPFRTCFSPMALAWVRFCDSPSRRHSSVHPYFAPSLQRRYGYYQLVLIFLSPGFAHACWLRGAVGDRKVSPRSMDRPVVQDHHDYTPTL